MSIKTRFINKSRLTQINRELAKHGYSAYPGDSTTAHPNGCSSGYVSNLVQWLSPATDSERREIENIVARVIGFS